MSASPTTGGVILAAGGGSRFANSGHKLLAEVDGRPLIGWALAAMVGSGIRDLAVVTGSVDLAPHVPAGVTEVRNERWAAGQATSLAAAVEWATTCGLDAIVVGLGDQPGLVPAAWRAVAATCDTPVAVATYGGRRGHPVRLARAVWDRLPTSGDQGAGVVMAESPELVTEVACDGDAHDVDTVEDLARWR